MQPPHRDLTEVHRRSIFLRARWAVREAEARVSLVSFFASCKRDRSELEGDDEIEFLRLPS